jgi:hypothetical protein
MPQSDPICLKCARYIYGRTCEAFPEEIPESIWLGEKDHSSRVLGDGGKTFLSFKEAQDA